MPKTAARKTAALYAPPFLSYSHKKKLMGGGVQTPPPAGRGLSRKMRIGFTIHMLEETMKMSQSIRWWAHIDMIHIRVHACKL